MNYTKPLVLNTAMISPDQFKILYMVDSKSNECFFVF